MPEGNVSMSPIIFVINLKRSEDRWANMARQFESMGLKATRFEAVDGYAGHHFLFDRYDDELSWRLKGRRFSPGQLGCYASHYLIWHECVRKGLPIIVLEDDAIIEPVIFRAFLDNAGFFTDHFECIRLFENNSKHHKAILVQDYGKFAVFKYTKGPMRAIGYYLTPSGAKKFLEHAGRWFLPVDITMDRFWANRVECHGISPACVKNAPDYETTVPKHVKKRSLVTRFRRESFSGREGLSRFFYNIKFHIGHALHPRAQVGNSDRQL
jgi:glycosyl transferase, family 25